MNCALVAAWEPQVILGPLRLRRQTRTSYSLYRCSPAPEWCHQVPMISNDSANPEESRQVYLHQQLCKHRSWKPWDWSRIPVQLRAPIKLRMAEARHTDNIEVHMCSIGE